MATAKVWWLYKTWFQFSNPHDHSGGLKSTSGTSCWQHELSNPVRGWGNSHHKMVGILYKTHWEDNKLHITVTWLALGQVLSCVLWWDLHTGSGMSPPAASPTAISSLRCRMPWHWSQLSKMESETAYPWSLVKFLTWNDQTPTHFPSQDQDPGKWSPLKSCFQGQVSSLHIPRCRQSIF